MNVHPQLQLRRAGAPGRRQGAARRRAAAALFWGSHAAYRASTSTVQLCDSTYSLIVSEQLLAAGSHDLTDRVPADAAARRTMPGFDAGQDLPYHLVRKPDPHRPDAPPRIHYGYPLGSSVLSLPFVWHYVRNKGMRSTGPDGLPSYKNEGEIQQRIAAVVAAGIVVLFFFVARFFCPAQSAR